MVYVYVSRHYLPDALIFCASLNSSFVSRCRQANGLRSLGLDVAVHCQLDQHVNLHTGA